MVACKFLLPRQVTNIPGIQHIWFVVQLMMMYGNDKDENLSLKFGQGVMSTSLKFNINIGR